MAALDILLALVLPALIIVHLIVAPYTKVEESFTIQAAHDILVYGTPTHDISARFHETYDHFSFPGAVPRSFVGPVLLAGVSQPLVALVGFAHAQLVVRAVLGLFNAACLLFFSRELRRGLGRATARWWIVLMAGQFHVVFYASRTLPNMFAFGLTTLASAHLLPHPDPKRQSPRQRVAISALVFAAVIFRSEVAVLLATTGLHLLTRRASLMADLAVPFAVSFAAALAISVPLDSYFWQKTLWPELWGFVYNVVHGGASAWGISPWHYYFTSAIPRLLLNPLVPAFLVPLACLRPATARTARDLVVPSLLFVAIYSLQPHKEARFVFYVVPPFTAVAAQGAAFVTSPDRRARAPLLHGLGTAAVVLSAVASSAFATTMLLVSSLNYPGGEALTELYRAVDGHSSSSLGTAAVPTVPTVHVDVLSCMTGATLFGQNRAGLPLLLNGDDIRDRTATTTTSSSSNNTLLVLDFDKTEEKSVLANPVFWSRFDYLLLEDPGKVVVVDIDGEGNGNGGAFKDQWDTLAVVQGYAGLEVLTPGPASEDMDKEEEQEEKEMATKVVGKGRVLAEMKERVRALTGGWWIGPRMEPRIHILRRRQDDDDRDEEGGA